MGKRLHVEDHLARRLEVTNDQAKACGELDHNHGGLAVGCIAARCRFGYYGMVESKRKGRRGLGCSPRPQTLAKQVGVGVELAS